MLCCFDSERMCTLNAAQSMAYICHLMDRDASELQCTANPGLPHRVLMQADLELTRVSMACCAPQAQC